ncbi:MAG: hypothetical protein OHK0013_44970 [Sandaracinaceae bacterium]
MVVAVEPARDGHAQLVGGLPAPKPHEHLLHRADEALRDGVARGPADWRKGVVDVPALAEVVAIGAGVLRAVVGAGLDVARDVRRCAERLAKLELHRREHCGPCWSLLTTMAVRSLLSMVGKRATVPSRRVHTVVRSVAMRRFGS